MNNKFLDKVIEQIISETRVIDNKLYTPFSSLPFRFLLPVSSFLSSHFSFLSSFSFSFSSHCKEVYSLNNKETEYVWVKYKEGLTALMDKKELTYE